VGYKRVKPALVASASGDRNGVTQCVRPVWTIDVGGRVIYHHKWGVSTERLHVAARSP